MRKLYLLLSLIFFSFSQAQIINIPDANFKAKLLQADVINSIAQDVSYNNIKIDVNNDGEIEVSEVINVARLDVSNSNIISLQGISEFININYLNASFNVITSLDISQNTLLESLFFDENQITSLDVSQNINLGFLYCSYNQITNLDISQNLGLGFLSCGSNQLTNLTLGQAGGVSGLELLCENNFLVNVDFSQNTNLAYLGCQGNLFTTINLTQNQNLYALSCDDNPQLISLFLKNCNIRNGGHLFFGNNPNLQYICANEDDIQMIQQKINQYGYTNCHVNSYCSFVPGGTFYEISGNTKFDFNTNGCDALDIDYSNLNFTISDGINTGNLITNQTGDYYIPVQAGAYTITPNLENPSYFTISPTSYTVNFPVQASPFTQDFCVSANGVHSDVEVVVFPTTPARPGFDANYKIVYRNKGNQTENGSVSLTFDDAILVYVSSNPIFDASATNLYTWNFINLQPFETREIEIIFNVNSPMESPAVNIDDVLSYTASTFISNTDETPEDNSFILNQTVGGSYDPNDKTCLQGETVGPSMIGEYVHYTIRFENTGTAAAQNIVVKDMIDVSKFDIATLIPLKGSHEYYTRINDNKVEFIFENINLDFNDATNDGYVAFKIKTLNSLIVGDSFSNDANIYFDYNFPITTNTYTTTIAALNNQSFEFNSQFTLYPNPAIEVLNIQSKNSLEMQSIEIYNLLGQLVLAIPNTTNTIDVANLTSGTYFIKVNTEKGSTNTKFIKE